MSRRLENIYGTFSFVEVYESGPQCRSTQNGHDLILACAVFILCYVQSLVCVMCSL